MSDSRQRAICSMLGVSSTTHHGTYLGIPSMVGRSKKKVVEYVKHRVWNCIQNWGVKKLSRARKEVLLKTVAQAMPNYTMSVFLSPLGVCHEIENMFNSLWWKNTGNEGKGISWMRWERICKPKSVGGLGFKKLHEFNLALLRKHGWKFLIDPMSLVSQVYRARCFPHSSFLNSKLGANPSYTWRSIHATKDLIQKHSRFRVGDGTNILVTKDLWLPINGSGMISSVLGESQNEITVY